MRRRPATLLALTQRPQQRTGYSLQARNLAQDPRREFGRLARPESGSPSLFSEWDAFDKKAPKDQWTYCETLGKTECKKRLEQHWDTWVTESRSVI